MKICKAKTNSIKNSQTINTSLILKAKVLIKNLAYNLDKEKKYSIETKWPN